MALRVAYTLFFFLVLFLFFLFFSSLYFFFLYANSTKAEELLTLLKRYEHHHWLDEYTEVCLRDPTDAVSVLHGSGIITQEYTEPPHHAKTHRTSVSPPTGRHH